MINQFSKKLLITVLLITIILIVPGCGKKNSISDFKESVIPSQVSSLLTDDTLSINGGNNSRVWQSGDWVYIAEIDKSKTDPMSSRSLYRMRIDGSNKQQLNAIYASDIVLSGEWVYYNCGDGPVYRIKKDGSSRISEDVIKDDISGGFAVFGDWVYYANDDDDDKFYRTKTDGSGQQKLNDDQLAGVKAYNNWIYYGNRNDGTKIYRVQADGSGKQKLSDDRASGIGGGVGDWIYYLCREPNSSGNYCDIFKIRTDGSGRQRLTNEGMAASVNVAGDWIYYLNGSDSLKIYRISTDGKVKQKVCDDLQIQRYVDIAGDWVYYETSSSPPNEVYRIKTDGSGREVLQF